jgi:hypothetical protein
VIDFVRGAEAEAFAGAMVEVVSDARAEALGEVTERRTLGQVLSDEAVGVLVGAAFPSVMGIGEEDGGIESMLDGFVAVKLDSVVEGDGVHGMGLVGEERDQTSGGEVGGGPGHRADADQAALALDDGGDAGRALTVNRVAFPVSDPAPLCDDGGALLEHPLAREASSAVVLPVALAAPFLSAPQVGPEDAAALFILPDPQVDRFVAHHGQPEAAQAAHDLFRTPAPPEQSPDQLEVARAIASIAPRAAAAAVRLLHREHRAVESVVGTVIASDLAPNGAGMSMQGRRDLADRVPLGSHRCDRVSFLSA